MGMYGSASRGLCVCVRYHFITGTSHTLLKLEGKLVFLQMLSHARSLMYIVAYHGSCLKDALSRHVAYRAPVL